MLKVLQERHFSPVGGHQTKRFAGRVIAATNKTLDALRSHAFRDDFFYRLCADIISVPSLNQRLQETPEELPKLVELLLNRIIGTPEPSLLKQVLNALQQLPQHYHWPGNVRELAQAIRRILLTGHYQNHHAVENHFLQHLQQGTLTAQQLLSHYCQQLYQRHQSYEAVARCTGLDRRTVKKYINQNI